MKSNFLETFEEKFYFKTSHLIWHVFIGIAGIGLIAGILIFLWGLSPSFKPGVEKPEYPEPVQISAAEIRQIIQPTPSPVEPSKVQPITAAAGPAPVKTEVPPPAAAPGISQAEQLYLKTLDSLRTLLPPEKFAWQSRGHWVRGWYENRWVIDEYGIKDRLNNAFQAINANDFGLKTKLVSSYLPLLTRFGAEKRLPAFRAAMEVTRENLAATQTTLALLINAADSFNVETSDFIKDLATFSVRNPRDGHPFLRYINQIIPKFDAEFRPAILSLMIRFYDRRFEVIERQKEATDLFLPMLGDFKGKEQLQALDEYYQLYLNRNESRAWEIRKLEENYAQSVLEAENVLATKKQTKAGFRSLAWKIMGGSLLVIALVALFLVLFSIQRNIRLLRENMVVAK